MTTPRSTTPASRVRGSEKESGAYNLNILNVMGREQKNARNELYQSAIVNPEGYLNQRGIAEQAVVEVYISMIYKDFKDLLLNGKMDGDQVLCLANGNAYAPKLPEAKITKYAIKACETIQSILEDMVEECYPTKYGDLAGKKTAELAEAAHA